MNDVQIPSITIVNYRSFRHLRLARLGEVNLVVGKNNIGKTSLLEALWLFAHRSSLSAIWDVLEMRGEATRPKKTDSAEDLEEQIRALSYLFYGVGEISQEASDVFSFVVDKSDIQFIEAELHWMVAQGLVAGVSLPVLSITLGNKQDHQVIHYPLDLNQRITSRRLEDIPVEFVTSKGLDHKRMERLWDRIALTDAEREMLLGLQIIAPQVQDVRLISANGNGRTAIVRISGINKPLPIGTLGEGTNRIFGLVLAMVNAKNGILLVDEIENGLHYGVLPEVWQMLFRLAKHLNVQVFATTHSWECVETFQQVAKEDTATDGQLISLRAKEDEPGVVVAVPYNEEELEVATKYGIEVR